MLGRAVRAVEDITLDVAAGEVVGIAGPNGAGKSTLIAMLLGFLPPDEGTVRIDGVTPRAFVEREGIAYLPELITLPLEWRAIEALARLSALAGIPTALRAVECARVIEAVGIAEHADKRLKALSKGNLQRLGLAQALLADRRVMVFDEPTHGLDPVWTARFRDIVGGLRRADRAILIASHNLDELERLCDRVAIIDRGRLQRVVSVREAEGALGSVVRRWKVRAATGIEALAAHLPGAVVAGQTLECTLDLAALNAGLAVAIAQGALVTAVVPAESSLEEAFRTAVTR
ncbi:MAG: ABC transporter ATP-binding protein [Gemmatimonadota bacterium]|nr:ABC transporter ATP-binding protein [Gemmatimonadota bacterium]